MKIKNKGINDKEVTVYSPQSFTCTSNGRSVLMYGSDLSRPFGEAFGFDAVSTGVMSNGLNVVETRSGADGLVGILRASSTATMYDCDDVRLVVVVLDDM
mgnify:CR=1 FL=1